MPVLYRLPSTPPPPSPPYAFKCHFIAVYRKSRQSITFSLSRNVLPEIKKSSVSRAPPFVTFYVEPKKLAMVYISLSAPYPSIPRTNL